MKERRSEFEQQLDKQLKQFVINIIKFRNNFDVISPDINDLNEEEGLKVLKTFKEK